MDLTGGGGGGRGLHMRRGLKCPFAYGKNLIVLKLTTN